MRNRHSMQFWKILIAAMVLGALSPTIADASYPILKLDFGASNTAAQTEPGFISFIAADTGKVVDGITIELGGTIDARWRGGPTGIPMELLYRDFLFARPGGMTVTLSGLQPNETYDITIYAYDNGSGMGGDRITDWLANGDYCLTAGFTASIAPVNPDDYASTGPAVADGNGRIVLEATANPNTAELSGANNPFAFLNGLVVSSMTPVTKARHPVPADGSTTTATAPELDWDGGMLSTSSNVYFGDDLEKVSNATTADPEFCGNTIDTSFLVGSAGNPYPDGLVPGTTYYWRIDEVNEANPDSPWKGDVWSFTVASKLASDPEPVDGSLFADPNVLLSWTAGVGAVSHHVYFGESLQDVQAGAPGTDKGDVSDPNYAPGLLALETTYYWRVDEFDGTTTLTGDVWSFTTTLPGLGTVTMDRWDGISGSTLDMLRGSPDYPSNPTSTEQLTEFGTANSIGDNYGARIYGWLYVPMTGDYKFWFTSADQGELFLSTDDDPANAQLLAREPTWGDYNTFSRWSDYIPLIGGNKYYILAEWQEGGDWDHCQVAWEGPGIRGRQIIQGSYLSPFEPVTAYGPTPPNGATNVDPIRVLRWKAGKFASEHRVYFGTDPNAVLAAGTGSPEYRGTQPVGSESYDPGTLTLETSYYWRIDEVNNANPESPWVSELWSFTTGNFHVVDDFESYNDLNEDVEGSNRIYNTWLDGWYTPETNGAVVGYSAPNFDLGEHIAETTIIHGGRQAMPFKYDNDMKYSEAVRSFSGVERDWTREGVDTLSLWFRGNSGPVGSFVEEPAGTYTITASGTDITGEADEFHFAYKQLTGPGSITAQVLSVSNTDAWAKAGVMIRATLDPKSPHALACVTPGSGVASEGRLTAGDTSFSFNQTGITAPHWVKLERKADGEFVVTHSADGVTWETVELALSQWILMEDPVYIGLAVTAHNADATCEAVFSNVSMTGTISSGPWEHQDVGIVSNDPEPLYVALNGTAVIPYADGDPQVVLTEEWTEWQIPLADFAALGVNLADVDSMAIGVGTQGNTTMAGGSGTLYFDDIRLYRPAAAVEE
jgi:hypothetical protein